MKIVTRKQFLAMPSGTVYAEYRPAYFGPICIKGDTWGNDFLTQDLIELETDSQMSLWNDFEAVVSEGMSLNLDYDSHSRDGMFDENCFFAVWEKEDMESLIRRLNFSLSGM